MELIIKRTNTMMENENYMEECDVMQEEG